jgi:hypothetical protein
MLSVSLATLLAFTMRAIPAVVFNHGADYDIASYRTIGRLVLAGRDIYADPAAFGLYPYLPGQMWLSALALLLSQHLAVPFVVLAKIPAVLADTAIVPCIIGGLRRRGVAPTRALACGLVYAVNPVSIMISAYHGQFDALPLLGCMIAWSLLETRDDAGVGHAALAGAGVALGVAILTKTWPVLLLPVYVLALRSWSSRLVLGIVAFVVPVTVTMSYAFLHQASLRTIAHVIMSYGSVGGWWGLGLVLGVARASHLISAIQYRRLSQISELLVLAAVGGYLWHTKTRDIAHNCVLVILIFFTISASLSIQYLVWIVPFMVIDLSLPSLMIIAFIVFSSIALVINYMGGWMFQLFSFGSWHALGLPNALFIPVWLSGVFYLCAYRLISKPGALEKRG